MAHRIINFNAGPSTLPLDVLKIVQEELLDYRGTVSSDTLEFKGASGNLSTKARLSNDPGRGRWPRGGAPGGWGGGGGISREADPGWPWTGTVDWPR